MRYFNPLKYMMPKKAVKQKVQYHIYVDGRQAGPLTEAEMKALVKNGVVTPQTLIWMPSLPQWVAACNIPEINRFFLLNTTKSANAPKKEEVIINNKTFDEAMAALTTLGFSKKETSATVNAILSNNPTISTEDIVKQVLKEKVH